jgi:hypothetical protein
VGAIVGETDGEDVGENVGYCDGSSTRLDGVHSIMQAVIKGYTKW